MKILKTSSQLKIVKRTVIKQKLNKKKSLSIIKKQCLVIV